MRTLYLIRHAQTKVDPSMDSELWQLEPSAKKVCQSLAKTLELSGITRVVSSDMPRARETGRVIAKHLTIPCQTAPNLHEHERTGVPFMGEEIWLKTVTSFFTHQDKLVFGKETAVQVRERFDKAVKEVLERYPNEKLAICSHGTVMSLFIAYYNPVDILEFWQTLKMPDVVRLSSETFKLLS